MENKENKIKEWIAIIGLTISLMIAMGFVLFKDIELEQYKNYGRIDTDDTFKIGYLNLTDDLEYIEIIDLTNFTTFHFSNITFSVMYKNTYQNEYYCMRIYADGEVW